MKIRMTMATLTIAASAVLIGCPADETTNPDGPVGGSDASGGAGGSGGNGGDGAAGGGSGGDGGMTSAPRVQAHDGDQIVAADFSCRGVRTAPTAGADTTATMPVLAFGEMADGNPVVVPGATVQIYPSNDTQGGMCGADCTTGTEVNPGLYEVTVPSPGWFSYWVDGGPDFHPTLENHTSLAPAPQPNWFNLMRRATLSGLFALLGEVADPNAALIAGRILDCNGLPVSGAELRVFDGQGSADGVIAYFAETGLPSVDLEWTTSQARWTLANAPAGSPLRVELWGVVEDGGDTELLGCELMESYPDTVSSAGIGPLRADGPSDCGN